MKIGGRVPTAAMTTLLSAEQPNNGTEAATYTAADIVSAIESATSVDEMERSSSADRTMARA